MKIKIKIIFFSILFALLTACDAGLDLDSDNQKPQQNLSKQDLLINQAQNGNEQAQTLLGIFNISGSNGFEQNTDRGIMWLKRAATTNAAAMNLLGDVYHLGEGEIKPDLKKALYWYTKAYENNDKSSMVSIGFFYNNGLGGLTKNCYKAIEIYTEVDSYGFLESERSEELSFLNNFAWTLATCEDSRARDGRLALDKVERIYKLTNNIDERILDTAAAANAEIGNYSEAIDLQTKALQLIDRSASEKRYTSFEKRLEFYKQGKNWRGNSPAEIEFYEKNN